MQRRTSMATTWASSNPHSPELLVCYPADPGLNTTIEIRFCGPKSSLLSIRQGIVAGGKNIRRTKHEVVEEKWFGEIRSSVGFRFRVLRSCRRLAADGQ